MLTSLGVMRRGRSVNLLKGLKVSPYSVAQVDGCHHGLFSGGTRRVQMNRQI